MNAPTIAAVHAAGSSAPARAPIRIVHLGLGAFHRAHQAWYTARAEDADAWGIEAFTGRSRELADTLSRQQGLYTLVTRSADGDRAEIIDSIVAASAGTEVARFSERVADPATALVTLTVTEGGYLTSDADVAALLGHDPAHATALGRVALGLQQRARSGSGPLALVSCDNVPGNGRRLRDELRTLTREADPDLALWIDDNVGFVDTSVDRITPRCTPDESAEIVRRWGWTDEAPVVTEPFSDWILSGSFPAGRPAWETAGARFVSDVGRWERRKLWLLNGAHTILAALGPAQGHATVAEAIADPHLFELVDGFWDEAVRHLRSVEVDDYRRALVARFRNPRIVHRLDQIGQDARTKARLRLQPVAVAERAEGRPATAVARVLSEWAAVDRVSGEGRDAFLADVAPELARDETFRAQFGSAGDSPSSGH